MSVAIRRSLYGKMAGDTTLVALLASPVGATGTPAAGYSKPIFYGQAPQGANFPYIVFSKASGTPRYALAERAMDNDLWLVKAVAKDKDGGADVADSISERLDALLTDGTLSISGKTQLYLRRESDVDYPESSDGQLYRHAGSYFRFIYD